MNGLQLHRKWVEWEGKQAVATWLYALVHNVLMGFYPAHKSTLCNSKLVVVKGVHFLARLGVIAFSAITVTKNAPLEPSTTACVGGEEYENL